MSARALARQAEGGGAGGQRAAGPSWLQACSAGLPALRPQLLDRAPHASHPPHRPPGLWVILGAGLAAALLWLAGLRFLATRKLRKRHAAAAAAAAAAAKLGPDAEAGGVGLPLANGGPRGSEDHLRRRGGKEYKAGVAFRQTVSIFGAQVG